MVFTDQISLGKMPNMVRYGSISGTNLS